ncbi:MAG: TlpA disulfide reductase family protein [Myxococcota bacterium]
MVSSASRSGRIGFALILAAACGGGGEALGTGVPARVPPPVELGLQTPEGTDLDLQELRGRRVLLFLFATFDGESQAVLNSLERFVERHPEIYVIGIAVQPNPEQLLDAWNTALDPPFVTTFEPRATIQEGVSDLGEIDAVPTLVLLDGDGRIENRKVGFANFQEIEALLRAPNRDP